MEVFDWLLIQKGFPNILSSASAFADHPAIMHSLWAETLRYSPEQIWNDVTTFTPSRFFAQAIASSVGYMAQASMGQLDLSQVPLCTISSEAPGVNELGV